MIYTYIDINVQTCFVENKPNVLFLQKYVEMLPFSSSPNFDMTDETQL